MAQIESILVFWVYGFNLAYNSKLFGARNFYFGQETKILGVKGERGMFEKK